MVGRHEEVLSTLVEAANNLFGIISAPKWAIQVA